MDEEDVVSADAEQTAEPTEDEAFEAALFPKGDDAGETDEADDEEPEEDDDSDDEEEDEEPASPEPIADRAALVKMPDGTVKTLGEIMDGGMATADYTRKTQAVAQERKQLREQYQAALAQWAVQQEQEPDWHALAQRDPVRYVQEQAAWTARKQKSDLASAQWRQIQAEVDAEARQEQEQQIAQSLAMLKDQIPELADPETQPKVAKQMQDAGRFLGYEDNELQGITDARLLRGLHLVSQLMDIQSQTPAITKKVAATSRSLTTSARSGKANPKAETKKARARLRETGGSDDAFLAFLTSG